jgi:hypothetical protein
MPPQSASGHIAWEAVPHGGEVPKGQRHQYFYYGKVCILTYMVLFFEIDINLCSGQQVIAAGLPSGHMQHSSPPSPGLFLPYKPDGGMQMAVVYQVWSYRRVESSLLVNWTPNYSFRTMRYLSS